MENAKISIVVGGYRYILSRELNNIDQIVLNFTEILNNLKINYVVVSGYVAILFGRSRLSEDIDIIVENLDFKKFRKLWDSLDNNFWCIITGDVEEAYKKYLLSNTAIRFAPINSIIPNIKMKFPKTSLEKWVLENALTVNVGDMKIKISSIEIQIAFKLYLGSEKDIEDSVHLYEFFKEGIDKEKMNEFIKLLKVEERARRYLKWNIHK